MSTSLETKLRTILNEKDAKILPENIKKGIKIFNVEGAYGGAKIFTSIEEMQADSTANVGDLAIIYKEDIQHAKVDSKFSNATFPKTVVLPTALTSDTYIDIMYRATDSSVQFDCWGQLDSSMFQMSCYTETDNINIRYTSSDGITYTRTDTNPEIIDFGTEIYYAYPDYWNDTISYFIVLGSMAFEGLYQNELYDVKDYITFILTQDVEVNDDLTRTYIGTPYGKYATADIFEVASKILTEELSNASYFSANIVLKQDKMYLITKYSSTYNQYSSLVTIYDYSSGIYYLSQSSGKDYPVYSFEIDLESKTYTKSTLSKAFDTYESPLYDAYDFGQDTLSVELNYDTSSKTFSIGALNGGNSCDVSTSTAYYNNHPIAGLPSTSYYKSNKYFIAPTQFTVADSSELVPNKTALGKNGPVTGDGSIYEHLDPEYIRKIILGLDDWTTSTTKVGNVPIILSEARLYSVDTNLNDKTIRDTTLTQASRFTIPYASGSDRDIYSFGLTKHNGIYYLANASGTTTDNTFSIISFTLNKGVCNIISSKTFTTPVYVNFPVCMKGYGDEILIAGSNNSKPYLVRYSITNKTCSYVACNTSTNYYLKLDIHPETNTAYYTSTSEIIAWNYSTNTVSVLYSNLAMRQYGKTFVLLSFLLINIKF